jgi:chorismate-pyruvate lyase
VVARYYDKTVPMEGASCFRSEGFLRDGSLTGERGQRLPLVELPPFLRALLVTDGTVTKILEAYFWEPVEVRTLEQDFWTVERPVDWLEVPSGERVLIRLAHLTGTDSGRTYADAFSVIRADLIPANFRQRLIDREIGIGVLIRDSGLESYREVLEIGIDQPAPCDQPDPGEERVYRTYRIFIAGKPVILITESFPLALYAAT